MRIELSGVMIGSSRFTLLALIWFTSWAAPQGAAAGDIYSTCSEHFALKPAVIAGREYYYRYAQFFGKNLRGEGEQKPLSFVWSVHYPPHAKFYDVGAVKYEFSGTRVRDFTGQPGNLLSPIVGIKHFLVGTHVKSDDFYERVYKNYEGVIREQTIRDAHAVDASLEDDRVSLGMVGPGSTFRVYDGSQRPFGWQFRPAMTNPDPLGTLLPFQRMNMRRHLAPLDVERVLALEKLRGRKVFELGKFSLNGEPQDRVRARNLIEAFWFKDFAVPYEDAIFTAHCVSAAHVRLYKSRYGFEVAESFSVPGSPEKEYILWITGRDLAKKLGALIGLEVRPVTSDDPLVPTPLPTLNKDAFVH